MEVANNFPDFYLICYTWIDYYKTNASPGMKLLIDLAHFYSACNIACLLISKIVQM